MLLVGALALIAVIGGSAWYFLRPTPSKAPSRLIRIGLSMDTVKIDRWPRERDIMSQEATAAGAILTPAVADGDSAVQANQIENFVSQKVDVIIVIAVDANGLSTALSDAKRAGIKVIDYDRLTFNSQPDLYVSFDSTKVGQIEAQYVVDALSKSIAKPKVAFVGGSPTDNNAVLVRDGAMGVLDPLVSAGKAQIVYDTFTADWSSSAAYAGLKAYLDGGGKLDAVVCSNDGMALGVVQALKEHGLDGKVPVSGQDGDITALQRIVAGTQTVTAYKPGKDLAKAAIAAAIDLANGRTPTTNGTTNNKQADIPSYLLNPQAVTKDTIKSTIIADGVYTSQQVYGASQQ